MLLRILFLGLDTVCGWLMYRAALRFLPPPGNRFFKLCAIALFTVGAGMVSWVGDENPLYMLAAYGLVFAVCWPGPPLSRMVVCAVFYPLLTSCNMLIDSIRPPYLLTGGGDLYKIFVWASKAAVWLLISFLIHRFTKKGEALKLSPRMWGLAGLLALAPLFAQLSFVLYNARREYDSSEVYEFVLRLAFTTLPFVLLSCLALLFFLTMMARYEQMEQEQQLSRVNQAYYESLEQRQTQLRRLRHDMANHLQTLAALPTEEKDAYLSELLDSPALRAPSRWSENRVINAVLSAKAEEMAGDHIRGDLSAPVAALLSFSDVDLCALLANSLDNAIEACRKLPPAMRKITLKARVDKGLFVLRVVNPCPGEPEVENGRLRTTKADRMQHGLGLDSIRSIAEKYGGSMSAGVREGDFELLLYLPLK